MKKYFDGIAILVSAAWVGGMCVVGYLVTPVLFQGIPDKALAGVVAGKIFSVMAIIGMVCAIYLLLYQFSQQGKQALRQVVFWLVLVMLLLTLLGYFGIQPLLADLKTQALPAYVMESAFAERFRFWHGASSVIFLIQSLLGAGLLLKMFSFKPWVIR